MPEAVPATRVVYGNLLGDLLVAYGIPVAAFSVLLGAGPLRRWRSRMRLATWQGLRWYGLLSVLGLFVTLVLATIFLAVDPGALQALSRTPPPLVAAAGDPWFFVGLSFAIGAIEETIFRGWIFGFWRNRPGSWLVPATWTSGLFAGLHLYYSSTYGIASGTWSFLASSWWGSRSPRRTGHRAGTSWSPRSSTVRSTPRPS